MKYSRYWEFPVPVRHTLITTIFIETKQSVTSPYHYCKGDVNIGLRAGGINNGAPFARHTQHAPLTLRWANLI